MKKTLLALALAGVASTASADSWIYAGGNLGSANYSCDVACDSNTTYGVNVGTGILPFIGVEAGYWSLGSVGNADLDTLYVGVKPSINFGPVEVYAKGGINKYNGNGWVNDDGYDTMYGVGVEYTIIDGIPLGAISLGAAYNKFGFDKFDVDTFSASLTFHFL